MRIDLVERQAKIEAFRKGLTFGLVLFCLSASAQIVTKKTAAGGGNITTTGAYASAPATCTAGDLYFATDSLYLMRCQPANTWTRWYRNFPVTPIVNGDFAWVNQGGSSLTVTAGTVYMDIDAVGTAANSLRIRKKAAPVVAYTVTAVFLLNKLVTRAATNENIEVGLVFREAGTGELMTCGFGMGGTNSLYQAASSTWTNETTFSANLGAVVIGVRDWIVIRVSDDPAGSRVCSYSSDGVNFETIATQAHATFLTADEVGWYGYSNANNVNSSVTAISWIQ